jgi:hypothetical protein
MLDNVIHGLFTLGKGLLIPALLGIVAWCLTYPIGYYGCSSYAQAKEFSFWRYRYFECYLQAKDGIWYTKQEYVSSQIGVKVNVLHENNVAEITRLGEK